MIAKRSGLEYGKGAILVQTSKDRKSAVCDTSPFQIKVSIPCTVLENKNIFVPAPDFLAYTIPILGRYIKLSPCVN